VLAANDDGYSASVPGTLASDGVFAGRTQIRREQ
jgi:hypothetical protein